MGHARDALHAKRSQAYVRDTHSKSAYVTFMKARIDLPEIRIQKVQNPIVFIAVALHQESNRYKRDLPYPFRGMFNASDLRCRGESWTASDTN
jgi:hypothetical protein